MAENEQILIGHLVEVRVDGMDARITEEHSTAVPISKSAMKRSWLEIWALMW